MRYEGVIEVYIGERGFGFISSKDDPKIFFHISKVIASEDPPLLTPGTRVTYERAHTSKGPSAVEVILLIDQGDPR